MVDDKKEQNKNAAKGCLAVLVLAAIISLIGVLNDNPSSPSSTAAKSTAAEPKEAAPPAVLRPGSTAHYLIAKGDAKTIIVWTDPDAMARGIKIAFSGEKDAPVDLLKPLISCIVAPGTKVIVDTADDASASIVVLSGASRGCEGAVPGDIVY